MKILIKEAEYKEIEKGDYVKLLEDYILFNSGIVGEVVGFNKEGDRVKVEFPMVFMNQIGNSKQRRSERFIYALPEELELVK